MSCHLTVFSSYKYSCFTRWTKTMGLAVGWFYVLWKMREWYMWKYCFIGMKGRGGRFEMDGLAPSCPALARWGWYRVVDMQSSYRKALCGLHFRTAAPWAHTHLVQVCRVLPWATAKRIPFSFLWALKAECSKLLKMCLTPHCLVPQDRETELGARLCLRIKLFIRKIEDKFSPGFFSINHSAEFSLVLLAQFLFVIELLCNSFWILFWWTIFKYCFERDHNLAEGEIKASG